MFFSSEIEMFFLRNRNGVFPEFSKKAKRIGASETEMHKSATIQNDMVVMKSTLHTAITRLCYLEINYKNLRGKSLTW